jgi:hypothetical protein
MVKKELQKLDRQNKRWNNILQKMLVDNYDKSFVIKVTGFENDYNIEDDIEGLRIFYVNPEFYIGIESIFVSYGQIGNYKLFQFKE